MYNQKRRENDKELLQAEDFVLSWPDTDVYQNELKFSKVALLCCRQLWKGASWSISKVRKSTGTCLRKISKVLNNTFSCAKHRKRWKKVNNFTNPFGTYYKNLQKIWGSSSKKWIKGEFLGQMAQVKKGGLI